MDTTKIVIDCDPGQDDAAAIVLAARSPEIELVGITCVAGNVDVEKTSENALKICELAGMKGVPVAKGMPQPLFGELLQATHVHGPSGLDGAVLPPPTLPLHPHHAVDFLVETFMTSQDDITLVPTAPLTNIAMAIWREPRIVEKIPRIIMMGGAMGMGNVTASAEFNIYVDPEAAHVVFNSGIPITMLGLDVTHQAILTRAHVAEIQKHGTPVADAFVGLFNFYLNAYARLWNKEGGALHDPCTVAAICDPSLLTTQLMRVDVELHGHLTRGRTVCDPGMQSGKPPNVRVGINFDADRFFAMLIDRLR